MTDEHRPNESNRAPGKTEPGESGTGARQSDSPPQTEVDRSGSTEPPPSQELTAEEQMARYEDELKESDWGHQPC
jgi:hypothetical protein